MAGITGLGTTYTLPNYTGELMNLTPTETPLLTAIGGLTGGRQATSVEFEWQTTDLRAPGQNVALEGQDAPSLTARTRQNVTNVSQIHQSAVGVSYTKLAAIGQNSGTNNDATNPVTDELTFQVRAELAAMAMDVDFSFVYGTYQKPADNTTARKTRGLLAAITTNRTDLGTLSGTGATAATDTITSTAHGLTNGDKVVFTAVGAATNLTQWGVYFVQAVATNTFKVALTAAGTPLTLGTLTGLAWRKPSTTALTYSTLGVFIQSVYDNGGMRGAVPTLMVGSQQKRNLSAALIDLGAKAMPVRERVGGVVVETIETDFGVMAVMLHPRAPRDGIVAVTLDELAPVFLETPGKGHMFAEPLAKTGAQDKVQLYGEVGLAYGAENHHGVLLGLPV